MQAHTQAVDVPTGSLLQTQKQLQTRRSWLESTLTLVWSLAPHTKRPRRSPQLCVGYETYRTQSSLWTMKQPLNKLQPLLAAVLILREVRLINLFGLQILKEPYNGASALPRHSPQESRWHRDPAEDTSIPLHTLKGPSLIFQLPHKESACSPESLWLQQETLLSASSEILNGSFIPLQTPSSRNPCASLLAENLPRDLNFA